MRIKYSLILLLIFFLFFGCTDDGGTTKKLSVITLANGGQFENGTISVKDNLKEAAKGDTITLIASPSNYYSLASITVIGETTNKTIPVPGDGSERTFTMPGEPVKITAASFQIDAGVYGITMMGQYYNGWVTSINGDRYKAGLARAGETVTLIIVPDDGYYLSSVILTKKKTDEAISASEINIDNVNNRITFSMPADDVDIRDYNNGLIFLPIN